MSLSCRQISIEVHLIEIPLAVGEISYLCLGVYLCTRREHISSHTRDICLACETAKSHALHEVSQM